MEKMEFIPKRLSIIRINKGGNLLFTCSSKKHPVTNAWGNARGCLESGYVLLGDGRSYKLTAYDKRFIRKKLKELGNIKDDKS